MAQVLKRCACDRGQWSKCEHSWTVRWWDPAAGKQREKSFKRNHKQAAVFSKKIESDKLSVHRGEPEQISFRVYAETWIGSHSATPGTKRVYRYALKNHLIPQFGSRKLTDVAAEREGVSAYLRSLPPGTARTCRTVLSALLTEARRAGRVE